MSKIKEFYRYNNDLCFRLDGYAYVFLEDGIDSIDWRDVIFVCPKHRIDMIKVDNVMRNFPGFRLYCPLCEQEDTEYQPIRFDRQQYDVLQRKALSLLGKNNLKDAKLIRLDDVYTPEVRRFDALGDTESNYSVKVDVKTDKDGDTIVILYIGYKGKKEKTQIFVKPEKCQLSHDYKDMDPAKILSKIEVTLRNRKITQEYESI